MSDEEECQERLLDRHNKRKAKQVPGKARPARRRATMESGDQTAQQLSTFTSKAFVQQYSSSTPKASSATSSSKSFMAKQHRSTEAQRSRDLALNEYRVEMELQTQRHSNLATSTENMYSRYQSHWRVSAVLERGHVTGKQTLRNRTNLSIRSFSRSGALERDTRIISYSQNDSRFTWPRIWLRKRMKMKVSIQYVSYEERTGKLHPARKSIPWRRPTDFLLMRPWVLTSRLLAIYTSLRRRILRTPPCTQNRIHDPETSEDL
ncbi:hypothetical protein BC939DRAFT_71033 [Gamsiella multidivaricata]|uniref:uncharacterized protein n=1 Tax=Gamsiella multidivaricata TaxID=101098 RepID=UPI002220D12A|nr:uncharacterized protein BC939DRAFT_71033 [Gamsiella multidivaricata]KAI7828215.1 hypothetical protein BC939DRAFT_71033 [Gamsiella multidivaricata]